MQRPMHGEILCQKGECQNRAYWELDNVFLCGVHSRNKKERVALEKIPEKERKALFAQKVADNKKTAKEAARRNTGRGKLGLFRMRMMKEVPLQDGFFNVFPNYRHFEKNKLYILGYIKLRGNAKTGARRDSFPEEGL